MVQCNVYNPKLPMTPMQDSLRNPPSSHRTIVDVPVTTDDVWSQAFNVRDVSGGRRDVLYAGRQERQAERVQVEVAQKECHLFGCYSYRLVLAVGARVEGGSRVSVATWCFY